VVQNTSAPYIANNTVYNMPRAGISTYTSGTTGATIINNIIVNSNQNSAGFANIDDPASSTKSTNLCFGSGGTAGCSIIGQDPLFVSTTVPNFRLQPGSPAIDKGSVLGAPYNAPPYNVDLTGLARPTGGYDIGAYETGIAIVTTPQLNRPAADEGPARLPRCIGAKNNASFVGGVTWTEQAGSASVQLDGTDI
jgi:hypothetical protein